MKNAVIDVVEAIMGICLILALALLYVYLTPPQMSAECDRARADFATTTTPTVKGSNK